VIPLDGVVISGHSFVDQSAITGESIPEEKTVGSKVICGTVNYNPTGQSGNANLIGSLIIKVEATKNETILENIIKTVEIAQNSKAAIQHTVDKISRFVVPSVLVIAGATLVGWGLNGASLEECIRSCLAVLVVSCPCSIGLATPTAVSVATGTLARQGILVKKAEYLEAVGKSSVVLLDKTGTITEGLPKVTKFVSAPTVEEEAMQEDVFADCLSKAAALELMSEHPMAKAVVDFVKNSGVQISTENLSNFWAVPGKGISGQIQDRHIVIGNQKMLAHVGVNEEHVAAMMAALQQREGIKTSMMMAIDSQLVGAFVLEDSIKANAEEAIRALTQMGIKTCLVTGDSWDIALSVAGRVGIDSSNVFAEVTPVEKLDIVKSFQKNNSIVAMVGDGVNDAPALAGANVSFSFSSGSNIAMETADITILGSDLSKIGTTIRMSKSCLRVIKQNLFASFVYNATCLPMASLGHLYPSLGAFFHAMSSVSVISNSLRLHNKK